MSKKRIALFALFLLCLTLGALSLDGKFPHKNLAAVLTLVTGLTFVLLSTISVVATTNNGKRK